MKKPQQLVLDIPEPSISDLHNQLRDIHLRQRRHEYYRLSAIKRWDVKEIDKLDLLIQDCRKEGDVIVNKIISLLKNKL